MLHGRLLLLQSDADQIHIVALQIEQGGCGPTLFRQRINVERSSETSTGGRGHIPLGLVRHRAFAEHSRHTTVANGRDQPGHALGCDLTLGVHRPEIGLLETIILGQITERTFAAHQQPSFDWNRLESSAQIPVQLGELLLVGGAIGGKGIGTGRIQP